MKLLLAAIVQFGLALLIGAAGLFLGMTILGFVSDPHVILQYTPKKVALSVAFYFMFVTVGGTLLFIPGLIGSLIAAILLTRLHSRLLLFLLAGAVGFIIFYTWLLSIENIMRWRTNSVDGFSLLLREGFSYLAIWAAPFGFAFASLLSKRLLYRESTAAEQDAAANP